MATKLKLSLILIFISFCIFIPALSFQFTNWDDDKFIIHNSDIRSLSFPSVAKMFTSYYEGGYQPLTQMSFAIDYAWSGLNPFGYHLTNVILHSLNAVLIFHVLILLDIPVAVCFLTVAFWASHPLRVESVAWVSERKDVLFAFFYLSGMLLYLQNRIKSTWVFFVLACLAKHQAASFCAVLILLDSYKMRFTSINWSKWRVYIIFILTGMGILLVTALNAQKAWTNVGMYGVSDKIFLGAFGAVIYAVKTFIPYQLSALYSYPAKVNGFFPWYVYAMPLLVVIVLGSAWGYRRKWPVMFLGVSFFMLNVMLPLVNIAAGGYFVNDRYTYIPAVGLWLCLAYGLWQILTRIHKKLFTWFIVLLWIALASATMRYMPAWHDGVSLWSDVIRQYPKFHFIYDNRGTAYALAGNDTEAFRDFTTAIMLNPAFASAYNNRAVLYDKHGQSDLALKDFNEALLRDPQYAAGYYNRGLFFNAHGRAAEALQDFQQAHRLGMIIDQRLLQN